jgi:hypothetical protein
VPLAAAQHRSPAVKRVEDVGMTRFGGRLRS